MQQDQTYKELFLQPEMLRALLEVYGPKGLAESLDFSTLEDIGTELLGSKGQKRQSDLIFKIRFQEKCFLYLILLLEVQQNQYRGLLVLRMLEYITLIWKKISDKEKDSKTLPPVLPILLHTGHQSFTRPTSIQEILSPYPKFLARFQPSFEFFLVDEFSQQAKARKLFDPASVLFLANHADTIENYQLAIQRMQTLLLDEKLGTIVELMGKGCDSLVEKFLISLK